MPEYISAADERRAAAWTLRQIRGDLVGAQLVADDGPISALAVFRACTAAAPDLWLDPDAAADRLEGHVRQLLEHEHGIDDDGRNDE
ncbi:hypothetical protein P3H15_11300 [Rhodococcus sp. T2V]|uniref:hypothetical protein n=1 Tax=Rhodococcus sp. T2V TaxID=3034164 RepID=UPI0023E2EAF9|nr:hypothetical protein [Rhodococcus sp. T2V]MDF3305606.1 hypothetical protein [Rhodococcus sp. T2V]